MVVVVVVADFLIESRKREVPRSRRPFCSRITLDARSTNESIDDRIADVVSGFKMPRCCQDPPAPSGQAALPENPAHLRLLL